MQKRGVNPDSNEKFEHILRLPDLNISYFLILFKNIKLLQKVY